MEEKRKSAALDLTNGEPLRLLILFAIPMFIGSLFQLLYNMVDSAVLGRFVSKSALAAVGATATAHSLVFMVGNAVTNAVSILVSQAWGAKDHEKVRHTVGQAVLINIVFSAIIAVLSLSFSKPLMRLLNTPDSIIEDASLYLMITCSMFFGQMVYNTAASILRAAGDSRAPLYFLIFCSLLNIVLDLAAVVWLHLDVAGVAWATVISQCLSAIVSVTYMLRKYSVLRFRKSDIRPDGKIMKEYARIAVPMTLQNVLLSVGMLAMTYVINSFGEDIVAAYTVGGRVEQIATVLFSQVAFSFSIYSGQNYGAKKYDRITDGFLAAVKLLSGLVLAAMLIMFLFGDRLCLLFVQAEETAAIEAAVKMIHIDAAFMPMLCAIWLFNSALRGMGMIKPTVISSVIELASKIGLSFLLSALMGYVGIWLAAPLGWVVGLIPGVYAFCFSGWKKKVLEADRKAAADRA